MRSAPRAEDPAATMTNFARTAGIGLPTPPHRLPTRRARHTASKSNERMCPCSKRAVSAAKTRRVKQYRVSSAVHIAFPPARSGFFGTAFRLFCRARRPNALSAHRPRQCLYDDGSAVPDGYSYFYVDIRIFGVCRRLHFYFAFLPPPSAI